MKDAYAQSDHAIIFILFSKHSKLCLDVCFSVYIG